MQEYWVNVYGSGKDKLLGLPSIYKDIADKHLNFAVAYRLHVKMKPVYVQSYGRGVRSIVKPKDVKRIFLIEQPTHILDKIRFNRS